MTCPRCNGTGWRLVREYTDAHPDRLVPRCVPCPCHGWRPIGEAPMAQWVLVGAASILGPVWQADVATSFRGHWYDTRQQHLNYDPTHWQPLPDPPEVTT